MRERPRMVDVFLRSQQLPQLPTDEHRYLWFYLNFNEHQNSSGCYGLPTLCACNDLGWEREKYTEILFDLESAGLVRTDGATEEILIINCPSEPANDR
jgi:hypothetical protein